MIAQDQGAYGQDLEGAVMMMMNVEYWLIWRQVFLLITQNLSFFIIFLKIQGDVQNYYRNFRSSLSLESYQSSE